MSTRMGSINISLRKEAYEFLKSLKDSNKSFSDVILEFKDNEKVEKGSKEAVLKFFGVLKDIDWKSREKRMKELRKSFNKRLTERMK